MSPESPISLKQRLNRIFYFFPFQLFLLQLKRNYLLLSFWMLLFGFVLGAIGKKYGIAHLFLYPEYQGASGVLSFGILGFSIGGFIVSYNLYTYIIQGHRFPFIATLDKPLFKFVINNFILPAVFILTYCICSFRFQIGSELLSKSAALVNLLGFSIGVVLMGAFSFAYFHFTNRNVKYYAPKKAKTKKNKGHKEETFVSSALQKPTSWEDLERRTDDWRVDTYLNSFSKIMLARSSKHYPREVLEKVFSQHHINASLFELLIIMSFVVVGLFREYPVFEIPAAASTVLYFTVLTMLFSAIYSWVKGWTLPLFIALILTVNFSSNLTAWFNLETRIYGINYESERPEYSNESIKNSVSEIDYESSKEAQIRTLEAWKSRISKSDEEKPLLVMFSTSGGGLRSALWTMKSILYADSTMNGELLEKVHLITGSSGGMVGASYLREIYRNNKENYRQRYDSEYLKDISKDILNPIILAMATHDLALRYRKVKIGEQTHLMDRAHAFENKLNKNTRGWLDRSLEDYKMDEETAELPTMIFSPTINLDGRRLIMSSQDVSFLCHEKEGELEENVSYLNYFNAQDPLKTRFTSVLRMNATFPYILPASTLPTKFQVKAADAGLRDNFGLRLTLRYLEEMQDWIGENTSGVVIVEVRDTKKHSNRKPNEKRLLREITAPLGGVYSNVIRTQDYGNDLQFRLVKSTYNVPIYRVPFELERSEGKRVTLSWHLSQFEKETVLSGVNQSGYLNSLNRLKGLLENSENL